VRFLPPTLLLARKLSKGSKLLKRLGQSYSIEQRCTMTSLFNLTGKAALVTGGNGGIGLGIARGLAQAGARVAIIARNTEKSHAAAKALAEETGVRPLVLTADVSSPEQVAGVVTEANNGLGRIDILFNNAGISIRGLPQDLTPEDWHKVMDVNLTSAFLMSKAVYPHMRQIGGKIINIGSMTSYFGASYGSPNATSKGGIVQLTKSLALAWATDNIQVNALLPGWFETQLTDGARAHVPGLYERVLARIPAGRWAKPEDIAGTAIWLASSASGYVTGAAIPVDGGFSSCLF
jgi:2-deoxy-D-gluconate 3-dehydrogenase